MNGTTIHVSNTSLLENSLIATGFPVNNFDRIDSCLSAVEFFIRKTHGVRRMGAAAADLCYLACGRVDAFYEYNLKPWDVAAGALIAKNAGACISDFSGGENWLYGKEICAAGGLLFNDFQSVIGEKFLGIKT
jgi:myo-inositol-1(or 4)-monophosphatase